jgi:transcriptional regulator with XRE-family HTH domain
MFDPARIGRSIRAIRIRVGLRQEDLAERARVSRSFVSKVECGRAKTTDVARLEAICTALGADLDVRVRWQGEALDRLLDEAHAALVERTVALLAPLGWQFWLEVTFSIYGERGSIDVFAWHPTTRTLLIIEVKSVVADAQGTLAPLDRKVRLAPTIARERGLDPAAVARLLVVGDTMENRRRVERFAGLFAAALPARAWAVRRWLKDPSGPIAGLLFLSDSTRNGTRRTATGRRRVNPPRSAGFGLE